jgi:predicted amidohydrolase YtcJ
LSTFDPRSSLDRRNLLQGAIFLSAGAIAGGLIPGAAAYAAEGDADFVIRNGRVLVLDKGFRQAEAIAFRDGRVLAVGSDQEIRARMTSRTRELDARGGTVLPGINDTHLHLNIVGLNTYTVDVDKKSIAELVAAVRGAVQESKVPNTWIRGGGWQELVMPRPPVATSRVMQSR